MEDLTPEKQALEEAIAAAGGITQIARALNLASHNVVGQWRVNGVPAKHAPDIEALTGIACERLCPAVNWAVLRNREAAYQWQDHMKRLIALRTPEQIARMTAAIETKIQGVNA